MIKSHVRRFLNEKHDVVNAKQFVEACQSYRGVKNVNAVECRLEATRQSAKFHFTNVKKFRNFSFEREGIRAYRAWDIGEGVFFSYNKMISGVSVMMVQLLSFHSNIICYLLVESYRWLSEFVESHPINDIRLIIGSRHAYDEENERR